MPRASDRCHRPEVVHRGDYVIGADGAMLLSMSSMSSLTRLAAHGPECAIAAPVWHELTYGCERLAPGKHRRELEAYLNDVVLVSFPILPYDEASAHWHGLAHVHDLTLVTANSCDFARFRKLEVVNWTSAKKRR